MKKQILLLILLMLVAFCSYSQTWNQYKKEARKAFKKQDYDLALFYLDTMQKIDSAKFDLYFLQAEAAKQFNAFELAEKNYRQVLENEQSNDYAASTFGLAVVQKMQGKYQEAIQGFEDYLLINTDTTTIENQDARTQIQACKWAIDLTKIYDEDLVIEHLKSAVNSDFSDFSPFFYEDTLVYSSLQFIPESKKNKSNKKYSKILKFQEGNKAPTKFDLGLSDEETHTAHITFNKEGDQIYFTICQYVEGSRIQCEIYTRKKIDASNWGEAQALPEFINQEGTTNTQPAVGYDEKTAKETLYFVSDRPNEKGQRDLDIWMSFLEENGQPTQPINIKALNTSKDEMSPFFHNYTQTLYFSSNGRISLGGHDIYKTTFNNEKWGTPIHTGFPLNSSYNDVDFTLNHIGSEGYFASNRVGTRFLDKQISACCYDIFKAAFNAYPLDLNVLTYLKTDEHIEDLENVSVTVYEVFEDAEQEIPSKSHPEGINHLYRINSNKKYRVVAEKENYFPHEFEFNTEGPIEGDIVIQEAYLQPLKLNVLTFGDEPPEALMDVNVQLFQLDKDSNETEIALLYDPIGNSHFFPLLENQAYKIKAKKTKYNDFSEVFNTNIWESKTPILTKEIILKNATPIVILELKPFPLYFDNNLPFPNNTDTTTDITFSDAIELYKNRQVEFKKEYGKGYIDAKKQERELEIDKFFESEIDSSYQEFLKFTNSTLRRLKFGRFITITVKGYASPLASDAYNLALTKRRINSIQNFYKTYKNGEMAKYVESGSVQILLEPFGESLAPKEVSDNPMDKQNSVFSPLASQQRKVEIIGAESSKKKKITTTNSLE